MLEYGLRGILKEAKENRGRLPLQVTQHIVRTILGMYYKFTGYLRGTIKTISHLFRLLIKVKYEGNTTKAGGDFRI